MISELKQRARSSLSGRWWFSAGIMLLFGILTVVGGYIVAIVESIPTAFLMNAIYEDGTIGLYFIIILLYIVLVVADLFISGIFSLGLNKVFLLIARGNGGKVDDLFAYFAGWKRMVQAFKVTFFVSLYTALWSLLLIIPGIIKALSYSMTNFIIIDHPEYTVHQAIAESKRMMYGNKWKLFVLGLSFIGWFLLSAITCGIAQLWTMPYFNVTLAHFYENLSKEQEDIFE
ncbi:DUF975 family protein [Ectobacillus polymachus]|uniref:DUF975 family protein n=1 Tax=Ectobacillus polymachus TaxID=1508806 RepID=UPI003A88829F